MSLCSKPEGCPPGNVCAGTGGGGPAAGVRARHQEMLLKPSPDDWLMYSRTYDAQRFSPLKQITRQNVGQLARSFKKELGNGTAREHPDRLSRRHVHAAAGRRDAGDRRVDRRAHLGTQAAVRGLARQDDRHLRGHGLLPVPRRLHRGARRAHRRGALGDQDHRRHDVRRDRRRGQSHRRPRLRAAAARTATSRRTTPRPARKPGGSTPRPGPTSRAARRGAARPTAGAVGRDRGACPAATTRCDG